MKVTIDRERCAGHGRCYVFAPDVLDADDEGYGVVLLSEPPADLHAAVRQAARNCPEQAVIVEEVV